MDIFGISCSSKFKDYLKAEVLKPKDSERRILTAAGVTPSDKDAYWLGKHVERFVDHARMHSELLDLGLAIEAYLASRRVVVPAPAEWYMAQARKPVSDRFYMGMGAETGRRPVLHGNGCGNRSATGSTTEWVRQKSGMASCPMGLRFF